ncbi:unnamed protein product [Adineta steineri]|uniref:Uncharacterized protein n=1 Tax=Adineta steineri TaxID=433720 RepID=A0A819V821_9BILA|nr:unnamed protein product [Adineta steineri]CAF1478125.1 unnamed protein product [Adineta steineri]CAF1512079.1 unnamed protein product [Adineta steineri]CAF3774493.1 unnamed protein product [Adineta steineri]CAF4104963.1 unnamed protein product [Adineta steineri]
MSFIMNKIEEKIGLDLNKDGRVGGPGLTDKIEKKTHVDFNRDGLVGAHRPSPGGGLIGKIERATHIDINRDGYIGGAPGYLPPPQTHKKH